MEGQEVPPCGTSSAAQRVVWADPHRARGQLLLATLALGLFVSTFGMALPVLPPFITQRLSQSELVVGLAFGGYALAAVAVRPVVGAWADRRGPRGPAAYGCAVAALALGAHALAEGTASLIILRCIAGASQGAVVVGLMTIGLDAVPKSRRTAAANYLTVATQLGLGAGPVLGEILVDHLGYSALWAVAAGMSLLALGGVGVLAGGHRRAPGVDGGALVLHRAAVWPGGIVLLAVIAYTGFLTFAPLHGKDVGVDRVSRLLLLSAATTIVVRLLVARASQVLPPGPGAGTGLGVQALGLLGLGIWATPLGLHVSTIVMSTGWSLVTPLLMVLAVDAAPDAERGRVVGSFTLFMDGGVAIGPLLLGAMAGPLGYTTSFVVMAVLVLIGCAGLVRAMGAHRIGPASDTPSSPPRLAELPSLSEQEP